MSDLVPLATPDFYQAITNEYPPDGVLEAVSGMVRKFCGWHIVPQRVDTVTVDGTGGLYLLLPSAHVTDVLSATNDGSALDLANLEWSEAGMVKLASRWTPKLRGVSVQFEHGYELEDVPELSILVALIAARMMASPRGEISSSVAGISVQLSAGSVVGASLTSNEESQLAPYATSGMTTTGGSSRASRR